MVTKEILEKLYIQEDLTRNEIALMFNTSSTSIGRWLKKYNIIKDKNQIQTKRVANQKKSFIEKYGVEHTSKLESTKEKVKQTCLNRYGVDNAAKSKVIKDKVKSNNLKKYGETNPLKVTEIKDKVAKEQILKRGYSYPLQKDKDEKILNILKDKESLKEYLKTFKEKPLINELARICNYHRTGISHILKKYQLEHLIKRFESSYEKEIKNIFPNKFEKTRKILKPLEIDLYNKDYNLGVEFNGNYWHSIDNKGFNYHKNKTDLAESQNIQLIHIFQYEWDNETKRRKIITYLKNIVDDSRITIYARQCIIKEVDKKTSNKFLQDFHLQGKDSSSIKIGLYYKDELIQLMTFVKPRFNKNYDYELSRLCSHKDYKIVGGAEKLLKYFIKNNNPKNIISYCDRSKFTGKVYRRLNFEFIKNTNPNYVWCNYKGETLTRYQCQKHKLIKLYPELKHLSESEIMRELGYFKIEDCGNQVWVYNNHSNL